MPIAVEFSGNALMLCLLRRGARGDGRSDFAHFTTNIAGTQLGLVGGGGEAGLLEELSVHVAVHL